jgi:hypothetical protein
VSRYTHVAYGLGFVITREAIDDNQYEKKALNNTKALARSFRQTKENVCANVYNRAFSSSYVGGDGVCLLSASHPTQAGNQSNVLATAADLSEASLEDLCVQIAGAVDGRGLKIALMPKKLIIPYQLMFEASASSSRWARTTPPTTPSTRSVRWACSRTAPRSTTT